MNGPVFALGWTTNSPAWEIDSRPVMTGSNLGQKRTFVRDFLYPRP